MPVYNGQAFLTRALDSICAQTYRDLEVVVVNDGSTDDTAQILDAYQRKDSRVRVCHQDNQGLADALNRSCRLARGTYLARMDSDDIAYPNRIARQVDYLHRYQRIAVVGTQARLVSSDGKPSTFVTREPVSPAAVRRRLPDGNVLVHPSVIMRREAYEQTTGYRRAVAPAEDYDLWLRIAQRHDIANLPDTLLDYAVHPGQASSKMLRQQVFGALAARLAARNRQRDHLDHVDKVERDDLDRLGASEGQIERAYIQGCVEMANKTWTVGDHSYAFSLLDAVSANGLSSSGIRRLRSERLWLSAKHARAQGLRVVCCQRVIGACLAHPAAAVRVWRRWGYRG